MCACGETNENSVSIQKHCSVKNRSAGLTVRCSTLCLTRRTRQPACSHGLPCRPRASGAARPAHPNPNPVAPPARRGPPAAAGVPARGAGGGRRFGASRLRRQHPDFNTSVEKKKNPYIMSDTRDSCQYQLSILCPFSEVQPIDRTVRLRCMNSPSKTRSGSTLELHFHPSPRKQASQIGDRMILLSTCFGSR